MFYDLELRTLM
jgi:Bardet-Biedl syndrome 7 protein